MHFADYAVVLAYFITMVLVGVVYSRRMKSLETYFASGKQLSWWLGGVSFVMGSMSALAIIVYAALGYEYGLVALTIYWTTVPAVVLSTWILALRWRRAGILTPTEFLETRFSLAVRQLFVWATMPLKLVDDALKIVAIGIFVAVGLKISPAAAAIAVGLVTLFYTMLGGLWAVVITDFVQFILVTTGIAVLVPLTLHAAGGWRHVIAALPPKFFDPVRAPYTWAYVGSFLILTVLSTAGNWSLIQRFYSARNDRECRGVGWLASLIFLLLPPAWILTGIFARAFIAPSGFDPQTIYARVSAALLPPGMFGLAVAALLAAAMSVIASSYNVTAAVLTVDVHQRLIRPAASQHELVFVGRLLTVVVAIFALVVALAIIHFHWAIFGTMVAVFGFFVPPTVLPVLAGLLSRRLSAGGAVAGFLAGIVTGLFFLFFAYTSRRLDSNGVEAATIAASSLITVIVLVAAAFLFPAKGEAAERSTRFLDRLNRPAPPSGTTDNPAPIVGLIIGVMGVVLAVVGSGTIAGGFRTMTFVTGCVMLAMGIVIRCGPFANQATDRDAQDSKGPSWGGKEG